jgi:hypothetical protein
MSLMCAVFAPVWADWRKSEKQRRDTSSATAPVAKSLPGT